MGTAPYKNRELHIPPFNSYGVVDNHIRLFLLGNFLRWSNTGGCRCLGIPQWEMRRALEEAKSRMDTRRECERKKKKEETRE